MKKMLFVGNRPVRIEDLEVGYLPSTATVEMVWEISDFPEKVTMQIGMREIHGKEMPYTTQIRTTHFVEMIRTLYIHCGQKIQAIKFAREVLGIGLKEAKYFVESLAW